MTFRAGEGEPPSGKSHSHPLRVLAIDPGRDKCGVAVVVTDESGQQSVLERRIVPREHISRAVLPLLEQHAIRRIVLGHATTSKKLQDELHRILPEVEIVIVDETGSTLEARALYWQEHRPRGWRRLVPLSLQVPPEPVDDFAAIVLARRFLKHI
ncbi:MAG TPA: pre-16S rRNA-processing nuclease YqgF [Abditibacteriaceae bacterium]|jgi:RNase H-fold protein (predicted Holliday junction resolvase)